MSQYQTPASFSKRYDPMVPLAQNPHVVDAFVIGECSSNPKYVNFGDLQGEKLLHR